jgi:hypothetical protein
MKFLLYFLIALGTFNGLSEHPITSKYVIHEKSLLSASWPIFLASMITINQITELEENLQNFKKDK